MRVCLLLAWLWLTPLAATEAAGAPAITATVDEPAVGAPIEVTVDGLDPARRYWVTVVPADARVGSWDEYEYLEGADEHRLTFEGLAAGDYEVRLHDNAGGYRLYDRIDLRVGEEAVPSPPSAEVATVDTMDAPRRDEGDRGTAVAPDATADDGTGAASAPPSEVRARFADVFRVLDGHDVGFAAARAGVDEAVEAALVVLVKLEPNGAAARLGLTPDAFAAMITSDPNAFFQMIGKDVLTGIGTELAIETLARMITDFVMNEGGLAETLPDSLDNLVHAGIEAMFAEALALAAAGEPSAISLVGPVLRRAEDVVRIYRESNAVARAQEKGLLATALGAEIAAELVTDHPSDRSRAVAAQWRADTRANLPAIVGGLDAAQVGTIVDLGYAALLAQKQGDEAEAKHLVLQMRALGARGDGPFWLSADGPTDLLVKLAAWGDAPWRAALSFISATSLSNLVMGEDPELQLLRFDPAIAAREGFEAALRSVLAGEATERADCARLYPVPDEATLETLLVDLEIDLGPDAEHRRRVIRPELIEEDRLCPIVGSDCGSVGYCASGEALFLVGDRPVVAIAPASLPIITEPIQATVTGSRRVPVKGRDDCVVHTSLETPRWVDWDGPCRDGVAEGEGVLEWGRGDEVIQRIDARAGMDARLEGGRLVIEAPIDDYDFTLTICGAQSGYRRVQVDAPGDKRLAYFANAWLVDEILARAGRYADELCPMPRKGLSNIAVMINDGDGNQVVRARNYDEAHFTWRERRNRATTAMQAELERDNRERRRAKAERLAQIREHNLKQRMEKGRSQIKLAAENFLETGEGMFNHLACAVVYDDVATLERLEQGVAVTVAPAGAVRTVEVDGERYFAVRYRERSPYAQLEDQLREARRFSWAKWFDQVQAQSAPQVTLDCLFERGAEIPEGERSGYKVHGELVSFESSERGAHIVLRCRR